MQSAKTDYSLYLHIPFCRHRCAYCDFNTYAGQEDSIPAYVDALCKEIECVGAGAPARIRAHTVFFGGGTPSLLSPAQFKSILDAIRRSFDLSDSAEVTTEANPGTVSYNELRELRRLGINRISFGAQSANGEELRMLERTHSFQDVMDAVLSARRAGFYNLNLDLIYGLPEQSLAIWKTTVGRILQLKPEHISAYSLTLEHGTPFGNWSARGLLPIPDPDAAAEMYEWASGAFETAGYVQYEISNWAKHERREGGTGAALELASGVPPRFACRHNLQYWRCLPYLGFGAGAHGYANGMRYSNVLRIKTYIDRLKSHTESEIQALSSHQNELPLSETVFPLSPAAVNQHPQTAEDDMSELMIMGLRLTREGIPPQTFRERFGRSLAETYRKEIGELQRLELLEWVNQDQAGFEEISEALRLTPRGRLLGNQVFMRFV
jgi:oxygen-independent coproporphyrinogen III oxidase